MCMYSGLQGRDMAKGRVTALFLSLLFISLLILILYCS